MLLAAYIYFNNILCVIYYIFGRRLAGLARPVHGVQQRKNSVERYYILLYVAGNHLSWNETTITTTANEGYLETFL